MGVARAKGAQRAQRAQQRMLAVEAPLRARDAILHFFTISISQHQLKQVGKDKSDLIEEFVATWLWKPSGKVTEDEITLKADGDITEVTIAHTGLPEHGMQYLQGWADFYFSPMTAYFSRH